MILDLIKSVHLAGPLLGALLFIAWVLISLAWARTTKNGYSPRTELLVLGTGIWLIIGAIYLLTYLLSR